MKLLEQKIESLLFFKNEPVSFSWLSQRLGTSVELIKETIAGMERYYKNRGISLIVTTEAAALMTSESGQEIIQSLVNTKEEKELSKQAIETLSIIMYKGASTKSEIDYIRGVNSVFILRNLLIRGLVTKRANKDDKRSPFYVPTHDLLSFLGIENISQLPEFDSIQKKMSTIENEQSSEQKMASDSPINKDPSVELEGGIINN